MEKNWKTRLIVILLALNLMATGGMALYLANRLPCGESSAAPDDSMQISKKYTLYIGTNDKDTYTQLIPTEEARDRVNAICARYVDGYTASEARGGWVDETGTLTSEETLVYFFYDVSEEQIRGIMDEVLEELNQNTILLEEETACSMYYAGSKDRDD